jgi:hypothetical protein
MSLDETLDIGEDTGTAVCDDYKSRSGSTASSGGSRST